MIETPKSWPPELAPGTIIEFGTVDKLPPFEDALALHIDHRYNPETWAKRMAVKELIRPQRKNGQSINGQLGNVTLTVMADPYAQLLSARDRGLKIGRGPSNFERTAADAAQVIPLYRGFAFSAEVHTTGRKSPIGSVEVEAYYYPVPRKAIRDKPTTYSKSVSSETIRRVITLPLYKEGGVIELDEQAPRISADLACIALQRPIHS